MLMNFLFLGIIHVQSDTRIFCTPILLHGYKIVCCKLSHNEDKKCLVHISWHIAIHSLTNLEILLVATSQNHRITESQNCRGWKGPLEIIETNPPAKAGSLHQVAQLLQKFS